MQAATRETLESFVRRAKILANRNLVKHAVEQGLGLRMSLDVNGGLEFTENKPDEEAHAAFANTFRFFVQDNEHTSLRKVAENILIDPGVSQGWKDAFAKARDQLNAHLDALHPHIKVALLNGRAPTRRDILETFLWGEISHSTKSEQYLAWKARGPAFPFIELAYNEVLIDVLQTIWFISQITELELAGEEIPSLGD